MTFNNDRSDIYNLYGHYNRTSSLKHGTLPTFSDPTTTPYFRWNPKVPIKMTEYQRNQQRPLFGEYAPASSNSFHSRPNLVRSELDARLMQSVPSEATAIMLPEYPEYKHVHFASHDLYDPAHSCMRSRMSVMANAARAYGGSSSSGTSVSSSNKRQQQQQQRQQQQRQQQHQHQIENDEQQSPQPIKSILKRKPAKYHRSLDQVKMLSNKPFLSPDERQSVAMQMKKELHTPLDQLRRINLLKIEMHNKAAAAKAAAAAAALHVEKYEEGGDDNATSTSLRGILGSSSSKSQLPWTYFERKALEALKSDLDMDLTKRRREVAQEYFESPELLYEDVKRMKSMQEKRSSLTVHRGRDFRPYYYRERHRSSLHRFA